MTWHRVGFLAASALMAGALTGCFGAAELSSMRREIEKQTPGVEYDRVVELTAGPMSLGTIKFFSVFAPNIEVERQLLKEIDRVKVGVYEAGDSFSRGDFRPPELLNGLVQGGDWETVLKVDEPGESMWVLYRTEGETVRDFYMVMFGDSDSVLVQVEGSMDQLLVHVVSRAGALARQKKGTEAGLADVFANLGSIDPVHGASARRFYTGRNRTLADFWAVEPEGLQLRYNRVEGTYLGWRWTPAAWRYGLTRTGEVGFAFNGGDLRLPGRCGAASRRLDAGR